MLYNEVFAIFFFFLKKKKSNPEFNSNAFSFMSNFYNDLEEACGLLSSKENELVCMFVFFLSSFCLSIGA